MKQKQTTVLAVILTVGATAPLHAQPKVAPEMDQLKVFAGTWKCEGRTFAGPIGPEHPVQVTITGKPELDGFWMTMRREEKKSKDSPNPMKGSLMIGYDAAAR